MAACSKQKVECGPQCLPWVASCTWCRTMEAQPPSHLHAAGGGDVLAAVQGCNQLQRVHVRRDFARRLASHSAALRSKQMRQSWQPTWQPRDLAPPSSPKARLHVQKSCAATQLLAAISQRALASPTSLMALPLGGCGCSSSRRSDRLSLSSSLSTALSVPARGPHPAAAGPSSSPSSASLLTSASAISLPHCGTSPGPTPREALLVPTSVDWAASSTAKSRRITESTRGSSASAPSCTGRNDRQHKQQWWRRG